MANIINYNSWDTNFKTPCGALKTCESAIIKVESSKAFDVCSKIGRASCRERV